MWRRTLVADNTGTAEQGATPPNQGRQDHDAMRAGALRPIEGPAGSETLAASGGLELPGGERRTEHVVAASPKHEPIPGERDPSTQMKNPSK
jgi:hypothetical protein